MSIELHWIEQTLCEPCQIEQQQDGSYRYWRYIDEVDKYLRVIVMEDGETIHNAFFDRSFKENPDEN